ncbi:uncharacterized protein DEA37_0002723 [Paragonimus westermani]|uniref:Reverse transcriptase RNase H-like domain-containing protein n=1 Tax=Paragonimus westermani TaxID=34504 RepID=A0A5J4NAZ0_9TREM|nr:uncharacterized protein DEA37_0002723 [Paragonimus westermani]
MARPDARAVRHPPSVGLGRIPTSCRDVPLNVGKSTPPIWPSVVFRLPCLAHGSEKATAHAARSLTPAENNYSQIEKEALSIIFIVEEFHRMLYGRRFTLPKDYKLLLTIFGSKKGIPVYIANRLQRWVTMLLAYDFNIQYRNTRFWQGRCLVTPNQPEENKRLYLFVSYD